MQNKQQTSNLRKARITAVQQALVARRVAAKQAKYTKATNAHKQQAYHLAMQQLQAQYGIAPTQRSTSSAPASAPKAGTVCAQVWGIAAQHPGNRKAVLTACAAAGINAATAATQYARYQAHTKAAAH